MIAIVLGLMGLVAIGVLLLFIFRGWSWPGCLTERRWIGIIVILFGAASLLNFVVYGNPLGGVMCGMASLMWLLNFFLAEK